METITNHGVEFPIDGDIISGRLRKLLEKDYYEAPEAEGLARFVTEEDRVLEIGAGIGFISTYLRKILNVKEVLAFEANGDLLPYIESVHRLNKVGSIEVRNSVLFNDTADMPSAIPFYVTKPLHSSSLAKPTDGDYREVSVPTARLSDAIAEFDPTIIVCDIEGGETELFEAVDFKNVERVYAESHRRKYGGIGMRKLVHDLHRHDFFLNARYSADGQVLFNRLPKRQRGRWNP